MYVRAAAERFFSGTPMHLLFVDAPNRAIPTNGMFHARLEPLCAFVSSYPTGYDARDIASLWKVRSPYTRDTE